MSTHSFCCLSFTLINFTLIENKNKKFRPLERNDSNAQLHSKPSLAKKNATIRKSNNFYIQLQAKMISSKTHVLSMGHQIHVLSYDPGSDAIDVINYHANIAQDDPSNTKSYNYLLWVPSLKVSQGCRIQM